MVRFTTDTAAGTAEIEMRVADQVASIETSGTDSPSAVFAFRGDEVAALVDDAWDVEGGQQLEPVADTLFVVAPDITYAAAADVLVGASPAGREDLLGLASNRYDIEPVPATTATDQLGWSDAQVSIWVSAEGLPLQGRAVTELGSATWSLVQLGGDVEPRVPPEWAPR